MVTLMQLWIPILGSAVAIFVLSSLIHMVFKWHNSDYRPFANEDEVAAAIRKSNPSPGQYFLPHSTDMKAMKTPEFQQKYRSGPVAFLLLKAPGEFNMGRPLVLWFLYTFGVGIFVGYLASRTLPHGTDFASVFRLVATIAFMTYVGGSVQNGIWMGKPWASVAKDLLDGAIYGAATGAVFGCLWPQ